MDVRRAVLYRLYRYGLLRTGRVRINGKALILPDAHRNTFLRRISVLGVYGFDNDLALLLEAWPDRVRFVDVGANVGTYSFVASAMHPDWQVAAVEPLPRNAEYIRSTRDRNGLSFDVIEAAVAGERGEAGFGAPEAGSYYSANGSLLRDADLTVRTVMLADVLTAGPHLVKLDCEGVEFDILEASADVLARDDLDLIVELVMDEPRKHDTFRVLTEAGYRGYLITNGGLLPASLPLTVPKPDRTNSTLWRNHLFTKRSDVAAISEAAYGRYLG